MLADLFKPAWKSNSVDKRLKAIAAFDSENSEHQDILVKMASDDEEVTVCIAAIQKLKSVPLLHEISLKPGNDKKTEAVCNASSKRLDELMGESTSLDPQEFEDILKRYPELNVRVAAHAETASVRNQAIQGLSSVQLLEVLSVTVFTDLRQQIANMLLDSETLETARKIIHGKDKNAERIVKTKLDEFKNLERKKAENLVTVNQLIEEVEYLSKYLSSRDEWLPEFMPRCVAHCKLWDSLEFEIDNKLKQRYSVARDILDTQYQERLSVKETHQSQQKLVDELQVLLKEVAERDLQNSIEYFLETDEKHDKIATSWQSLALISVSDQIVSEQYLKMIATLKSSTQLVEQIAPLFPKEFPRENDSAQNISEESCTIDSEENSDNIASDKTAIKPQQQQNQSAQVLKTALNKLNWPSNYGVLKLESELRQLLAEWNKVKQDAAETYEQQLSVVHKNISSIFHFVKIGNLTRAKQSCAKVEKAIDKFSAEGNKKDLAALKTRYEEASQNLGEMGDWKSFATEPKYVELCEAMEQMIGSKKHPDKLFNDMKALQQQWKELGNSDVSDQYWPRFKEASDTVYKPCATFFEERRLLRKTNLEKRQQLVEEMRELLEQSDEKNNPDYKTIESTLRSINSRFIAIKDVEHKSGQKQWEQFTKLKDEIYGGLNVEYDANIELKQALIKQAEALAEELAKEENLTSLKTLQHRWKQVGVTRRKDDQKAWTEFKKQGDQVFGKIQQVRQGIRDETDQQLNAYRDIIKAIQTLAKTATELSKADHQFTALQASYDELPDLVKLPQQLPEKMIEGIQRDYRNACSQFDECHDRIINNIQKGQLDALRQKADLCTQLEALFSTKKDDEPEQKKIDEIQQKWDSITLEDFEFSSRIDERYKTSQTVVDRKEITTERRLICIKLEIANGTDTPVEDKAQRMQFQLDQMNESGFGQQTLNNDEVLKNLKLDWLCLPGAEPKQQVILDERFWCAFDLK